MQTNTTRRSLFKLAAGAAAYGAGAGAMAATSAAVAVLSPTKAHAATVTRSINPRLARAITLHQRVEAECERHDREIDDPARKAFARDLEAYPAPAPIPHERSTTSFQNFENKTVFLSTASVGGAAVARNVVNDPSWSEMGDEAWRQAHREIYEAHQRRDALLREQADRLKAYKDAAWKRHNLKAIERRAEALENRRGALWEYIVSMPVESLTDLCAKVNFIERLGDEPSECEASAVFADIKRIAAKA